MLLWINGPFGGGKTHTAFELQRRLPGSVVCDPEEPGFGLRRMMPPELRCDFQELAAWRGGVVEVLERVLTLHDGVVIAPMTVAKPQYFAETVGRLREKGHDVKHFTLMAERAVVAHRLRLRTGYIQHLWRGRGEYWAFKKLDEYLEPLSQPVFAQHIRTDDAPVHRVAETIATAAGLSLTPSTGSRLRAAGRRAAIGARHIRLR